ncbi:hypothetical protein H8959_007813, partial [Pygathrix nigripes]
MYMENSSGTQEDELNCSSNLSALERGGETGLGKSTLMDTLFNTKFEGEPATHTQPGVQLQSNTYDLQESNVRLKLTIVSTVGFGDQINKEDSTYSRTQHGHAHLPFAVIGSTEELKIGNKMMRARQYPWGTVQ